MKNEGKKHEFVGALVQSVETGRFAGLTLKHYAGPENDLKQILVRKIIIKREEKLSFTWRYKTRDIIKNLAGDEAYEIIDQALKHFGAATLLTLDFDLFYDGDKGTLKKMPPSRTEAPPLGHDREKNRPLESTGKPWLQDLQITDNSGKVLKNAQDKWRQINRYVEILGGLIAALPPGSLKIADMGSGKGYLTFALYDYLQDTLKIPAQVTGIEMRPDLVDLCNATAKKSAFEGLKFVRGTIADFNAADTDILIALHACDTATDDAIAKGIKAGAALIVVAPCCHKQIRREMESRAGAPDLDFLLAHGIFRERQAEMVSDGVRALILNYHGYDTKVFEFISDAHTPKNVMIVGTKNLKSPVKDPAILTKIAAAKTYFGIGFHHLEKALE